MNQSQINHVDYPAPQHDMTPRSGPITDLIWHHTAGSVSQTPLEIDQEHRNIGDAMIAYNYIIDKDGKIYDGRPTNVDSAATFGRNSESISIVLTGNFEENDAGYTGPPTDAQLTSLLELSIFLHRRFSSINRTIGHREVAGLFYGGDTNYATACPGSKLMEVKDHLVKKIAAAINVH